MAITRKLSLILIVVILLFSGCGNNDYRNVELSDFSAYIHTMDVGKPNYFRVITVNAIEDFSFTYEMIGYGNVSIDTNTIYVGDVKAERDYFVLISSTPKNFNITTCRNLKVISATGKVKK